ncbi:MAG: aldehyde dehydrogenase family protein [Akkermansiaceae bacterium]|nr:aldehyde dehydrogenase family protein [Armatimonadota bacterium]
MPGMDRALYTDFMDSPVFQQYVSGSWHQGNGETRPVVTPQTGETIAGVAVGTLADAQTALAESYRIFTDREEFRSQSAADRYVILRGIEAGLVARREEFARGITLESGKTIRDARGEVDRGLLVLSLAAEEARRFGGDVLPLDINEASRGRIGLTRRFPVGTVAALTPFNFPLNLLLHKVAPAIAVGNPVIVKPSERTPLTALRLAELVHSVCGDTNHPSQGAFSVLTPREPKAVAELLATDPRAPVLSFTGSDTVGWHLKSLANKKRVTLELGGNAAVIVCGDADVYQIVRRCVWGAFANAGQVCISVQRIFVDRKIFDRFVEEFIHATGRLVIGNPMNEDTDLGPMITPQARDNALKLVEEAESQGATTLLRGETSGYAHLSPTVLTDTKPEMRVRSTEAFAPLVCIEPFDSLADALALANEGRYGLQTGIFTQNIGQIFAAWNTLDVGAVIANDVPQYRVDSMPYGGERDSGFGREGIRYAIEEMTALRLLALNLQP